ncbi:MAG: YqeG family HAD IIIA-type phosphatase [Clostridia bacterium]|nr:YqeG family HAD IIIA-type phosphatase [Clostridia bacterium]
MFDRFMPDADFGTVFEIRASIIKAHGVEGVVFDIDDTLVRHGTPLPDEKIKEYFSSLHESGIKTALVSNNSSERAQKFGKELGVKAFGNAGKPKKSALFAPSAELDAPVEKILFVGDQLLTDCLCAKRNGMKFFLVDPIDPYENKFFYLKRLLEKPLLKIYKAKKKK